jgi:membrane protease YdiL (CAAX protease family)
MTAVVRAGGRAAGSRLAAWSRLAAGSRLAPPLLLGTGLAGLVGARWAATIEGSAGALAVGLVFGAGLLALALAGGMRLERPNAPRLAIAAGVLGGAVLIGLALMGLALAAQLTWAAAVGVADGSAGRLALGPGAWFAGGLAAWAAITVLVATAEELVLRGVLFDAIEHAFGGNVVAAVMVTSVVFALIHVPLYGWHVVPLDLGVGLLLGGLRLVSGGVIAPAAAHVIADLATWWL